MASQLARVTLCLALALLLAIPILPGQAANAADKAPRAKAGHARFVKDAQGVITDAKTGLQWRLGPNQHTHWDEAAAWVAGLNAHGGGWRLPWLRELIGLRRESPARCYHDAIFDVYGLSTPEGERFCPNVWTGKLYDSAAAWTYSFGAGMEGWDTRSGPAFPDYRAFAVRAGPGARASPVKEAPAARDHRFKKDAHGVVTDAKTGLQWLTGPNRDMNRTQAEAWVASLPATGQGWRTPLLDELRGLRKEYRKFCFHDAVFDVYGLADGDGRYCPYVWPEASPDQTLNCPFNFATGEEDCGYSDGAYAFGRAFAVRASK